MLTLDVAVDQLTPSPRTLRKNDGAVHRMIAAIKEYGMPIPILGRHRGEKVEIIDGHLRVKAARKLGMTTIPVVFCDGWTEAQVKGFRLLVNRSATWATWANELVALELADLDAVDFDLGLTGFDPFEIDEFLFPDAADSSAEETPELPKAAVSRLGDLWICDSHRILAGDATSQESVAQLYGPQRPKLLLTDPPYGVNYDPNWRERAGLGRAQQTGLVKNDDRADWTEVYKLFPGDVAYLWHAGVHAAEVAASLEAAGFRIRAQIIWVKQHFALSRGDYHWGHEPCWYAVREGKSSNWCGDRKQSTVWEVANLNPFGGSQNEPATGHGTQKPVEVMRRPILNNTRLKDIVYDPFLGSGTTLIAAELTDRICYGLEIDPCYVDVIVRRWQELTGKKAVLEADGRTFEQIGEERKQVEEVLPCPAQS
ncbi:MAG TPA: DNA modification methylase [Bryobacteraceae bacterium]|jgi:DNA modification methylase|nr:DNA modification methylase [Bryobacteraceae bacterium]